MKIKLIVPKWDLDDSKANGLPEEIKQWLLNHNYAVLDHETPKQKPVAAPPKSK